MITVQSSNELSDLNLNLIQLGETAHLITPPDTCALHYVRMGL